MIRDASLHGRATMPTIASTTSSAGVRPTVARSRSSLPAKCAYSAPVVTPARSAMPATVAASYPLLENSSSAASSNAAREFARGLSLIVPANRIASAARGFGVCFDLLLVGLHLLGLDLVGALHRGLDLRFHVRDRDHDEPGLALVESLTQLFQIATTHPRRRVSGQRTERGTAGPRCEEQ